MIDDFLYRAMAAGLGVAIVAAPLGCFVVWRRMAYFGATLAHSALLGIALGLVLGFDLMLGVVASSIAVTLIVAVSQRQQLIGGDTLLGILAHSGLALGLVVLGFLRGVRVDLMAYLFGDVLAVTTAEIAWIYGGGALILVTLAYIWRPLLAMTIHQELARAEGVPVLRLHVTFMLILAVAVAIAMKVVGVLLIVSLLIVPAAAARCLSRTPEAMAALAAAIGAASVIGGLFSSLRWDTPSGPSIVVVASVLFVLALGVSTLRRRQV